MTHLTVVVGLNTPSKLRPLPEEKANLVMAEMARLPDDLLRQRESGIRPRSKHRATRGTRTPRQRTRLDPESQRRIMKPGVDVHGGDAPGLRPRRENAMENRTTDAP